MATGWLGAYLLVKKLSKASNTDLMKMSKEKLQDLLGEDEMPAEQSQQICVLRDNQDFGESSSYETRRLALLMKQMSFPQ